MRISHTVTPGVRGRREGEGGSEVKEGGGGWEWRSAMKEGEGMSGSKGEGRSEVKEGGRAVRKADTHQQPYSPKAHTSDLCENSLVLRHSGASHLTGTFPCPAL